jgi:hypothetical protein
LDGLRRQTADFRRGLGEGGKVDPRANSVSSFDQSAAEFGQGRLHLTETAERARSDSFELSHVRLQNATSRGFAALCPLRPRGGGGGGEMGDTQPGSGRSGVVARDSDGLGFLSEAARDSGFGLEPGDFCSAGTSDGGVAFQAHS